MVSALILQQKNIYISGQNYGHFARIFPTKLNYETIVDKGRSKSPLLLKVTPQEISEAPTNLLFERGAQKIFYKSY